MADTTETKQAVEQNALADAPGFIDAQDFTALQSADFGVLTVTIQEQAGSLNDRKAKPVDRILAIRAIIANADWFFSSIALNAKEYADWSKGRTVDELFAAYTELYARYADRLGKSKRSSDGSASAASN